LGTSGARVSAVPARRQPVVGDTDPGERASPFNRTETPMLWTILIILAIVALALFILGRVRGGRGV
jgi:hypothetical protein